MFETIAAIQKALVYCALLAPCGLVLARLTLTTPQAITARTLAIGKWLLCTAILLTLAVVPQLVLRLGGEFSNDFLRIILANSLGAALGMRLVGEVLLLALFCFYPAARKMQLVAVALCLASFGINGHAATAGAIPAFLIVAHITAVAWWLGSLGILVLSSVSSSSQPDRETLARLVVQFSRQAQWIVGLLVLAGIVLFILLVDFSQQNWGTAYVQLFIAKIAFVIPLFGLVAYNKFVLTPLLVRGHGAAPAILTKAIIIELVLFAVILTATAVLTSYASPA